MSGKLTKFRGHEGITENHRSFIPENFLRYVLYIGKRLSDAEKFEALIFILPTTFKFPSKIEYGKHHLH